MKPKQPVKTKKQEKKNSNSWKKRINFIKQGLTSPSCTLTWKEIQIDLIVYRTYPVYVHEDCVLGIYNTLLTLQCCSLKFYI